MWWRAVSYTHLELVWYSFRFTRPDGSCVYLGRNGLGEQTSRQPWQLTVYELSLIHISFPDIPANPPRKCG